MLDKARRKVIERIAGREAIDPADVTKEAIKNELRRVRLKTAPAGSPLRPDLLEGFAAGGVDMQEAIAPPSVPEDAR